MSTVHLIVTIVWSPTQKLPCHGRISFSYHMLIKSEPSKGLNFDVVLRSLTARKCAEKRWQCPCWSHCYTIRELLTLFFRNSESCGRLCAWNKGHVNKNICCLLCSVSLCSIKTAGCVADDGNVGRQMYVVKGDIADADDIFVFSDAPSLVNYQKMKQLSTT